MVRLVLFLLALALSGCASMGGYHPSCSHSMCELRHLSHETDRSFQELDYD